jgi:tripartite-type tricarboxylate transporter receptor subunit TctC
VLPYTQNGRLRALAVSSAKRWPTVPDVPTVAESGLPGYEMVLWTGVLAPANTPAEIVSRLHREIAQVLEQPEVVQTFGKLGAIVRLLGPTEFDAYLKQELARWAQVGKRTGIRIN